MNGSADFKSMYIVADFNEIFTIEQYRTAIGDKLKDLDVGVLVLNAGYADTGPFWVKDDVEI